MKGKRRLRAFGLDTSRQQGVRAGSAALDTSCQFLAVKKVVIFRGEWILSPSRPSGRSMRLHRPVERIYNTAT